MRNVFAAAEIKDFADEWLTLFFSFFLSLSCIENKKYMESYVTDIFSEISSTMNINIVTNINNTFCYTCISLI